MTTIDDRVLWIDLETTGSDENELGAAILEFGVLITEGGDTYHSYRDIAEQNWVFGLDRDARIRLNMWDDVVLKMHGSSGLLIEALKVNGTAESYDHQIVEWIIANLDKGPNWEWQDGTKILWGGSGVAHFDRRWIKKFMPAVDEILTHYALDVGVVRRLFEAAAHTHVLKQEKPHRALDDAKLAATQWRHYFNWIRDRVPS